MDDDGELLLLLDREIDEDCELLLNRPERRALLLLLPLRDLVGMLFDDDRGDVCSGGVGGLATLSTSPPDFFLRDGISTIFFVAVDGTDDDDDDGLTVLIIL